MFIEKLNERRKKKRGHEIRYIKCYELRALRGILCTGLKAVALAEIYTIPLIGVLVKRSHTTIRTHVFRTMYIIGFVMKADERMFVSDEQVLII